MFQTDQSMNMVKRIWIYSRIIPLSLITPLSFITQTALAAGDSSGGLPQLDITTWPSQLFWLIVTFVIGYILISSLVAPSISSVLENRSTKISNDLETAKKAQDNAKEVYTSYEESLSEARSQAAIAAAKALEEAKAETASRDAAINKKLAASAKKAEARLSKMRDEALSSLEDLATETSQKIIAELTPVKVTKAVVKKHVTAHAKLQS
jgi:F-type H+-transporting ATPase subunit b